MVIKETEAALWIKVGKEKWQVLKVKNKQLLANGLREKGIKITKIMYSGALPEKYHKEMARWHPEVMEREWLRVARSIRKPLLELEKKVNAEEQAQSI